MRTLPSRQLSGQTALFPPPLECPLRHKPRQLTHSFGTCSTTHCRKVKQAANHPCDAPPPPAPTHQAGSRRAPPTQQLDRKGQGYPAPADCTASLRFTPPPPSCPYIKLTAGGYHSPNSWTRAGALKTLPLHQLSGQTAPFPPLCSPMPQILTPDTPIWHLQPRPLQQTLSPAPAIHRPPLDMDTHNVMPVIRLSCGVVAGTSATRSAHHPTTEHQKWCNPPVPPCPFSMDHPSSHGTGSVMPVIRLSCRVVAGASTTRSALHPTTEHQTSCVVPVSPASSLHVQQVPLSTQGPPLFTWTLTV